MHPTLFRAAYPGPRFLYRFHEAVTAVKLSASIVFFALRHRVQAICIADDETVGWLTLLSKYLLVRRTLIYCHGDDLQCAKEFVPRRRHWFCVADKIVAANQYSVDLADNAVWRFREQNRSCSQWCRSGPVSPIPPIRILDSTI